MYIDQNDETKYYVISSNIYNMRSYTNISINSLDDPIYQNNTTFFKEMSKKLEQASSCLSFTQFNIIFKQAVRKCIKKAEVDSTFTDALPSIKKWISNYSYDLEIMARILILESVTICKEIPAEALTKLNKVKHLLVDTDFQYLLPKVFIIESRIYEITNDRQAKLKTLKKCIQFGQNYALQYLKQSNQIRLQIADNMIIAYFQVYKLIKQTKPNASVEYLSKAYQAALKNYGHDHFSAVSLAQVLNQQKNLLINMDRFMPKALSQIQTIMIKKNTQLSVLYSWQEQLLVVQMYKIKGDEQKFVCESTMPIRLDMQKIKLLKSRNFNEWIQFSGSEIRINQDQLKKIIIPIQISKIQKASSHNLKQYGKGDIFRAEKQPEQLSSSSDDQAVVSQQQQKFLRFLSKDKQNLSRSKSKDHHTSRH